MDKVMLAIQLKLREGRPNPRLKPVSVEILSHLSE